MKLSIIKYLSIWSLVLFFAGCEDFLEIDPQNELTQESFPINKEDATQATNAVYSTIRDWFFNSGGFPIIDIMSDDARKGSNPGDQLSTIGPYDNFTSASKFEQFSLWWSTLYEGVKRANVVIEKVPAITMNTTLQNRYICEALFLRALFYFDMVRAWGGVPKATSIVVPAKLPRASAEEIYSLIEQDLLFAITGLPEKSEYDPVDLGRATKGAAKALLSKVYLFQNNFEDAEKYALEVINSGEYDLEPIFTNANSVDGEHGIESVFEVGALGMEDPFAGGGQYGNVQGVRGTPNRGWGFNRPSEDLRSSFETGDPRKKGTIIDLGDTLDGVLIKGDGGTDDITYDDFSNILERECYNRKVWTPGNNVATQFGHNRRLIRYAEVLLIAAEALNENNKPGEALTYLNEIRERAREGNNAILPDVTTTEKTDLREAVLLERRRELAMEGHRFWDLVRTGKAAEVLGSLGFKEGKHELLPIPQSEIDMSQGTLTQNPQW